MTRSGFANDDGRTDDRRDGDCYDDSGTVRTDGGRDTEHRSTGGRNRTATRDGDALDLDAPETSRRDEEIAVRVTGARPGATVSIEASTTDARGVEWRSSATFSADADGVVDLAERAPESGSYEGVAPMGWCWSMTADGDARVSDLRDAAPDAVEITAATETRRAERTITRRVSGPDVERRPVESDRLAGTLFEPSAAGPHPGVVALHGSGGNPPVDVAALLASRGYAALALRYFGDPDPVRDRLARVPLSYFETVAAWLRGREGVGDGPLGVVGHSRGGELALLLGSRFDWVGPVVSYAGSGVAYNTPHGPAAWTEGGEAVPHVEATDEHARPDDEGTAPMLERALDAADEATVEAAAFAVEEIDGPVRLVSGGEDPVWPSRRLSRIAADRLDERECAPEFEHLAFDDAGHYVTPPYLPKTDPVFGGTPEAMVRADERAWAAAVECLERGLEPGAD